MAPPRACAGRRAGLTTTGRDGAIGVAANVSLPTIAAIIASLTIAPIAWRGPRRGCHYEQDDAGKMLLVALATGLIAGIIANQ